MGNSLLFGPVQAAFEAGFFNKCPPTAQPSAPPISQLRLDSTKTAYSESCDFWRPARSSRKVVRGTLCIHRCPRLSPTQRQN
jgi:hypothetical protein